MQRFLLAAIVLASSCGLALAQSQSPPSDAKPSAGTAAQPKKGFVGDISDLTEKNSDFRRVLYTGKNLQLVLMSLKPGEDIGEEVHDNVDQFFRIEEGTGEVLINGLRSSVKSDDAIIVPAGARHNVKNTGTTPLRLYTIYGPPEHKDKTIHATKQQAESLEAPFDGKLSEPSD
jgi:mannose-6-phosphate isomerase-like protein (cupin superfamily)